MLVLLSFLVFGVSTSTAQPDRTPHRLLGTGDLVEGFGRIGAYGFGVEGLDERGRVLLSRHIGEREELYWADGTGIIPAIEPGALDSLDPWRSSPITPAGNFVVSGKSDASQPHWRRDTLYAIEQGRPRRIVTSGETDAEGNTLCSIHRPQINDAGAIAFEAEVALAGHSCSSWVEDENGGYYLDDFLENAVYITTSELRAVAHSGPYSLPSTERRRLALLQITDDGNAVIAISPIDSSATTNPEVVVAGPSDTKRIAVFDTSRFADLEILSANADGEVAFVAAEGGKRGFYRTSAGDFVRIAREGEASPFGDRFNNRNVAPQWASLNRRGDLLARLEYQNILYPAADAPWIVPGLSSYGKPYLNDAGDIAATERISPNGIEAVVLWRDQQGSRIAGTGDQLPDGSFLISGGLGSSCLADDGTVAVAAQADTGEAGLLCVDAAGTHVVTRVGDPTPAGRRFYEFAQCNISPADGIIFAAGRLVPGPPEAFSPYANYRVEYGIYRAGHDRLERLVGPGDVTIDGEVVGSVGSLFGAWQSQFYFDNDAAGRVLAFVYLEGANNAYTTAMVLRDTDGSLRRLPIAMNTGINSGGGIGFSSRSDTDHLYLSGESPVPTLDRRPSYERSFAESGSGAALAGMPAPDEERRLKVIAARLADAGDVIVLTVAQVRRWSGSSYEDGPAVLVRLSDSGLQQLFEGEEWVWNPGYYALNPHSLQVVGDRIVFNDGHRANGIFVYDLGDGQAVEVARAGNPSPAGTLYGIQQIAGLTADGTVYVPTWSEGRTALLSSQSGALQLVAEGDSIVPSAVSSGGTLLLSSREILRTQGDAPTAASCPMPPTVVLPTATVSSTPTMTPTRTPTRTPRSATPTPTAAALPPSASPTIPMSPSPTTTTPPLTCGPGVACIRIESVVGAPGSRVHFSVRLRTNDLPIAGVQNDTQLEGGGAFIRCAANRQIGKEATRFAVTERSVRAIVFSVENQSPIADGAVLYTCEIAIAPGTASGDYAIDCANPHASDARGGRQPVACSGGLLTVTAAASSTPSQTTRAIESTPSPAGAAEAEVQPAELDSSASAGCTLVEPRRAGYSWLLLIGAIILMELRFAVRLQSASRQRIDAARGSARL